jgi:hypothetical protein
MNSAGAKHGTITSSKSARVTGIVAASRLGVASRRDVAATAAWAAEESAIGGSLDQPE